MSPIPRRSTAVSILASALLTVGLVAVGATAPATAATGDSSATTAWKDGSFHLDPLGVVSRSDLILGRPNVDPTASVPLGNGSLAVAAWAAGGFTAQLNRSDTMPARKSPGQVTIPGLAALTNASDFTGHLDVTDGTLVESGGGMTLRAWVATDSDDLIVDVTGADPSATQSASINLWSGRNPTAAVSRAVGTLAETWKDGSGGSATGQTTGQTFGSLAAITAAGQNVTTTVTNSTTVTTKFKPNADGSFRVVVASPHWNGTQGDPGTYAASVIGSDATAPIADLTTSQQQWWQTFWSHAGLIEMNSDDGNAAYIENLRTLYLYEEAASEKAGIYPGSQAGEADMFAWSQDQQTWDPSSYWLWNLRAEISANMSSGNYQLNTPIFDMYINDLPTIEANTKADMGGLPGACVAETMRFNGNDDGNCDKANSPNWNALDLSSGPELSMYMWEQYQATGDVDFLTRAFPFMEATAHFLLAYQTVGADGLMHSVANAHETQWAVQDPTTDILAEQVVFPIVEKAAALVGDDSSSDPLLAQFHAAESKIAPYPRTDQSTHQQLLNPDYTQAETDAADATGTDMIGISYQPAAARQNGENIELEPLWPWNQVSDQDANLFALEQRSYAHRPNKGGNDWSLDAIDAARLEQSAQVESNLISITTSHQVYPNGFADIGNSVGYQPYLEQSASVAAATDEALAQDYDGIIRFAPAWPSDWDGSGSVYVQGNDKVDVQVEGGQLTTAAIEAGSTGTVKVKNPWPGQSVEVVDGDDGSTVVAASTDAIISLPTQSGHSYLVQQAGSTALPYAKVTGSAPTAARHLKGVQLGLDPAGADTTAVVGTVLGSHNSSYGLSQVECASSCGGGDGGTTAGTVAGLTERTSNGDTPAGDNDIYFNVDDSVARSGVYSGSVTVSYYDQGTSTIHVQYDNGSGDPYANAGTITLTGTNTWKTATVPFTGAYFGNGENGGSDFRLFDFASAGKAEIVHSVAVTVTGPNVPTETLFPPAPAITTPRANATVPTAGSVTGTSEPDGAITVKDGSSTLCTTTADDTGAWSCTPASALTSGKHSISATAADPTGLTSVASTAVSFIASDLPPGSATVGSVLGTTNSSYGMSEDEVASSGFDGPTTAGVIGGLSERTSTNSNIYFDVDDSIAHAGVYDVAWTISYYDQGSGSFQVQYDDGSTDPYKGATPSINLTNTNTWKTATVHSQSTAQAYFGGQQHSAADFRIRNGGGQVTVHSVVLTITGAGVANATDFPPATTITAPADGATASDSSPTIAGTTEPDASVTVSDHSATVCTATAADDGTWTCTPTAALSAGSHSLVATASDITATPGTVSAPVSYTVSSTAPTLSTGTPTITGSPAVGQTLAADPGAWGPDGVTLDYQWLRDGTAIDGATHASYKVTSADVGSRLSVEVTGHLDGYADATVTSHQTASVSAPVKPATIAKVTLGAPRTATVGQHVSVPATVTLTNGKPAVGATVTFTVGGHKTIRTTDAHGKATLAVTLLHAGAQAIQVTAGTNATTGTAHATATIKVAKAHAKVTIAIKKGRHHRITVYGHLPADATGTVTVTGRHGRILGHQRITERILPNGHRAVGYALTKKLAHGRYRIRVTYSGNATYTMTTTRTIKVIV